MSKVKPPSTLNTEGKKLWAEITGKYDLRVDELRTLEDICILTDDYAEDREAWIAKGKPRTTKGSMGQLVPHPDRVEMRANIKDRNALWRQLKLPDETGVKPNQQRDAAQSRWAQAHGTGA